MAPEINETIIRTVRFLFSFFSGSELICAMRMWSPSLTLTLSLSFSLCRSVSPKAPYQQTSGGLSWWSSVALNMGNTLKWLYQSYPGRRLATCPPVPSVTSSPWTRGQTFTHREIDIAQTRGWLSGAAGSSLGIRNSVSAHASPSHTRN